MEDNNLSLLSVDFYVCVIVVVCVKTVFKRFDKFELYLF